MKLKDYIEDVCLAVIIALVLMALVGCKTVPQVIEVPEPPTISVPARPLLPASSPPDVVVRSAMDYILQLEAALKQALAALDIYRKDTK